MISINFLSTQEMQKKIAEQARAKRLNLNLSQQSLAQRSGVSYGALKKFEKTGEISLKSLLKLSIVLKATNDFHALFAPESPEAALSLDALMKKDTRKRGRQ